MNVTEQNIVISAASCKESMLSGAALNLATEPKVVRKRLSEEDAELLTLQLCVHEAWMREYKALFEKRSGKVDANFASTMADPEYWELPDGRTVTIFDRTEEDIDTDSARTYDVFFDQGGFRIEHAPLGERIEVWDNYEPEERPLWQYSLASAHRDQSNAQEATSQEDGFNGDHLMFFRPDTPEYERQRMLYEQMFLSSDLTGHERNRLVLRQYLSARQNLEFLMEVDVQKVLEETGLSVDEQFLKWCEGSDLDQLGATSGLAAI